MVFFYTERKSKKILDGPFVGPQEVSKMHNGGKDGISMAFVQMVKNAKSRSDPDINKPSGRTVLSKNITHKRTSISLKSNSVVGNDLNMKKSEIRETSDVPAPWKTHRNHSKKKRRQRRKKKMNEDIFLFA